jgi:hypothetical protein
MLSPVRGKITEKEFVALLRAYLEWNQQEAAHMNELNRFRRAIYEDKATALATAILRIATERNLKSLRSTFQKITLTPSAQYYVLSLLRVGTTKDVLRIIKKVGTSDSEVRYWFQIQVAYAIERRMLELGGRIPVTLRRLCVCKAFREDPQRGKSRFSRGDMLPVKVSFNRGLFRRLVAHAAIGAARIEDSGLLKELAEHEFHLIARASAIRLTTLGGDAGIALLQSATADAIEQGHTESFAFAFRDAEIQKLGLAKLW